MNSKDDFEKMVKKYSEEIDRYKTLSKDVAEQKTQISKGVPTQLPAAPKSVPRMQQQNAVEDQRPVAPIRQKSTSPRAQQPTAPEIQQPMAPGTQQPTAPEIQQPMAPGTQQPTAPEIQQPTAPGTQQPTAPEIQQPTPPGTQQPTAPEIRQSPPPISPIQFNGTDAFEIFTVDNKNFRHQNEQFKNGDRLSKNLTGEGFLQVRIMTAQGAIPIDSAPVIISRKKGQSGQGDILFYNIKSNSDGATPILPLPTVGSEASQRPGATEPFVSYNINVTYPGFYTVDDINVPIFDKQTALQPIHLVPLPSEDELKNT